MTIRNEEYLRREENKMYSDKDTNFEIDRLLLEARNVLDENSKMLKSFQEMKKIKNDLTDKIINGLENISNSIPDDLKSFIKLRKSSEKLSGELSNKIDMINCEVITTTMAVRAMNRKLELSKKEIQPITTSIDNFIKRYKNGEIIANKDSIRELSNFKEILNIRLTDILKLENKYNQYHEKIIKLRISESIKALISPKNLGNNTRGLYIPKRLKTFIEVKSDFNKYDLSYKLEKQVLDFEQKIKSFDKSKNHLTYSEKSKDYFEKIKINKNSSNLLLNVDAKIIMNFIISERVSIFIDLLEHDTVHRTCFFKQIKGYEKQFEGMIRDLRQIENQIKEDNKQLSNLNDKLEKLTNKSEKETKIVRNEVMNKTKSVDKASESENKMAI